MEKREKMEKSYFQRDGRAKIRSRRPVRIWKTAVGDSAP